MSLQPSSSTPQTANSSSPVAKPTLTFAQRGKLAAKVVSAAVCVGVGLYAWSFIHSLAVASTGQVPGGLLQTKPKALLGDAYYLVSFGIHVLFGGIAMMTGWAQFIDGWRRSSPTAHRWLGRVYAFSIFLSAPAGFVVAAHSTGGAVTAAGFSGLDLFWLVSTTWGVAAIRGRQVAVHRKAMILSYAMTLSAVTQRIQLGIISGATGGNIALALQISSWLCWLPQFVPVWFLWRSIDREEAAKQARVAKARAAPSAEEEGLAMQQTGANEGEEASAETEEGK